MFSQVVAEMEVESQDVHKDTAPQTTGTSSERRSTKKKSDRARGDRGRNRFPEEVYRITEISPSGEPLAPLEALPKFRAAIGWLVKEEFDITWSDWSMVPEGKRKNCWTRLCTKFIFPEGTEGLVKGHVMKQLAISFRGYRHDMNKKWLQKGRDPTKRYPITAEQWARFSVIKNSDDSKAKSQAASRLAKKNKYHHHLGTGGYKTKIPKWRAEDEAKRREGKLALTDIVPERSANWLRARKANTESDEISCPNEIKPVAEKVLEATNLEKTGAFKSQRERDSLSHALGNKIIFSILFE